MDHLHLFAHLMWVFVYMFTCVVVVEPSTTTTIDHNAAAHGL